MSHPGGGGGLGFWWYGCFGFYLFGPGPRGTPGPHNIHASCLDGRTIHIYSSSCVPGRGHTPSGHSSPVRRLVRSVRYLVSRAHAAFPILSCFVGCIWTALRPSINSPAAFLNKRRLQLCCTFRKNKKKAAPVVYNTPRRSHEDVHRVGCRTTRIRAPAAGCSTSVCHYG